MDVLIKEINGKDTIWYSEQYLKNQMEQSYQAGLHKGIKVNFHAVEPMNESSKESLVSEFLKRVNDEYNKAYGNLEVWKK